MLRDDDLRGFLEIADARVVAETFPKFVKFGGRSLRGGLNRGQLAHPVFPIRDDGFDLRLLEHDFGNPDGVGIARATPREVAGILDKPGEELWDNGVDARPHPGPLPRERENRSPVFCGAGGVGSQESFCASCFCHGYRYVMIARIAAKGKTFVFFAFLCGY